MSLYRESGRTRPARLAAFAAVLLALGLTIGFGAGRATAPDPSGADLVAELRSELRPVAGSLAILPTEYPQDDPGAGDETAAVKGALARLDSAMRDVRPDLRALDPVD